MGNVNKLCKKCKKECKSSDKVQIVECKSFEHRDDGLYLVKEKFGLVKIGHTADIDKGLSELQSVIPYKLELLYYIKTKSYKVLSLEKLLHKEYENKRIRGEWFELTQQDIENIIKLIPFYDYMDIYIEEDTDSAHARKDYHKKKGRFIRLSETACTKLDSIVKNNNNISNIIESIILSYPIT